jgi:glycine/D-amino acid oxidase-like deaminating enzyme
MRSDRLRIAVVGGGIFGTTIAVELGRRGHIVTLHERSTDLLQSASGINQYRLHRGYHYPRSRETAMDCRDSEIDFRKAFGPAVLGHNEHFYAVAARDSLTTADDYLAFCRDLGLAVETATPDVLERRSVALAVRVREHLFDPVVLRALVWAQLRDAGVEVHLGSEVQMSDLDDADLVVVAAYADINRLLGDLPEARRSYQYEVCEKPVVRLPATFARKSVVVMDGPFMCFDPLGTGGTHVLGHVVHAIHSTNVGLRPEVPEALAPLLDRGIVERPAVTNIDRFIEAAREFFPEFDQAVHVGSMFTVRAVLPGVEGTDARPTLVRRVNDRVITVFSGKIATCIEASVKVASLVEERLSEIA